MDFVDRDVKCFDCGVMFVFSAAEQAFFKYRGFTNDRKHCRLCRILRGKGIRRTVETQVKCSECGSNTSVPFKPTQDRPVLCRACFGLKRGAVTERQRLTPNQASLGLQSAYAPTARATTEI
ncbi:MAG: CxxC-x17-CxxC domain-containing protein [Terracidiphilus sp.]